MLIALDGDQDLSTVKSFLDWRRAIGLGLISIPDCSLVAGDIVLRRIAVVIFNF